MKILIAGEGGQGVQLAGELLGKAAFLEGKSTLLIPNFGVEQRGGVSLVFVVIDTKEVVYPKFDKADFLLILSDRAIERVENYIGPKTKILPALKSALPAMVWNIVLLGKLIKETKIVNLASVKQAMEERLGDKFAKNPQLRKLNYQALGVK